MTAERPKCIDGEMCIQADGGYLLVPENPPRPNRMRNDTPMLGWNKNYHDAGNYVCSGYGFAIKRIIRGVITRCAACRRDWPNEEVPK